jgi:hypothetical protein
MLLAGVAPGTVSDQIGHRDPGFRLRVYGHVFQQQRDASAEAVEALYGTDVPTL